MMGIMMSEHVGHGNDRIGGATGGESGNGQACFGIHGPLHEPSGVPATKAANMGMFCVHVVSCLVNIGGED